MYRLTSHGVSEDFTKSCCCCGEAGFGFKTKRAQQWPPYMKLPPSPVLVRFKVFTSSLGFYGQWGRGIRSWLFLNGSAEKCIHFSFCPPKSFSFVLSASLPQYLSHLSITTERARWFFTYYICKIIGSHQALVERSLIPALLRQRQTD